MSEDGKRRRMLVERYGPIKGNRVADEEEGKKPAKKKSKRERKEEDED